MAGNRIRQAARIDLEGRLLGRPQLRVTPGGTDVLRIVVECGAEGEELRLAVVLTGDKARELAATLQQGCEVKVCGRLRALKAASRPVRPEDGLEVVADLVEQAGAD